MPLVADWATPDDVGHGTGVLYVEAWDGASDIELTMSIMHAFQLATMLAEDVPASLPDAERLRTTLIDNTNTTEIRTTAIRDVWKLANRFRQVTGNTRVQAAADELEQYLRDTYYAHYAASVPRQGFSFGAFALVSAVVIGAAYGAGRLLTHYRGRRHAHG